VPTIFPSIGVGERPHGWWLEVDVFGVPNSVRISSQVADTVPRLRRGSMRYRIDRLIPDGVVLV